MTREEAIDRLKKPFNDNPSTYYEALNMAIKALKREPYFWEKCPYYEPDIMFDGKEEYDMGKCTYKQEPCEDAISRQAVLEQTYNWSKDEFLRVTNPFDYLRKRINSLSSVKPQEPTNEIVQKAYEDGKKDGYVQAKVEQEPCEDAISRQTTLEPYKTLKDTDTLCVGLVRANILQQKTVKQLTGHWITGRIFPTKLSDENLIEYRCSECDRAIRCTESQLVNYPYCHCGAKMIEPQESEDKECY